MALIVMPSLLSKRPWARIRARCEASFFIILSKSARCCSVRGHTYLTIIHLGSGFTYRIVLKLSREILYQKTFGRALTPDARCRWHDSVGGHGRVAGHGRVTERRPGGRGAGTPREAYGSGTTVGRLPNRCRLGP